ncbi:bile acid:sodium symporter family protein [Actimicrobium sp. CCI2.3]|uniref:bile acid:sodium symporter family protein n=1 Tax=Actimicrobium sp. CCI2.3 TaxID=3048616 RepID=UPI002AB33F2B|nr:bile acid:sodium symporter family protein [Actimicrobium sp. CCI2.3]MDY7574978.1 bile acid:sodium symporter family protein [Actimicrobium sp. CCI2.3]MEB0021451.1 bile acid:sodium symporter family protein [Actimicrobium sp. CCI2.3]
MKRPRFLPDNFMLMMLATLVAATLLPAHGTTAGVFNVVTNVAICLLFFLHGAKLPPQAVIAGATHWRLHLMVLVCTFVLLPLLGLALKPLVAPLVTPDLYLGILFVCVLPSTVQSSIAFTSVARGNVPAAVVAASASNLLGIFLTPVLVGLVVVAHSGGLGSFDAIRNIALQLLLPFIAGQLFRRWIGGWVDAHKPVLKMVDQSAILLVVYTAFSEAVNQGLWQQLPSHSLLGLLLIDALLLGAIMLIATFGSRVLGFNKEDEITIVFCGSKKSLASGIPMAKILFAGHALGAVVLPLMLFHQLQLMVCAVLAQRYARREEPLREAG